MSIIFKSLNFYHKICLCPPPHPDLPFFQFPVEPARWNASMFSSTPSQVNLSTAACAIILIGLAAPQIPRGPRPLLQRTSERRVQYVIYQVYPKSGSFNPKTVFLSIGLCSEEWLPTRLLIFNDLKSPSCSELPQLLT